jgi:phosphate transport system protein
MLLHKEIQRLKQQMLFLGALIEERVNLAVKAVDTRDLALAQRVIEGDNEIDQMEVDLEEECLKVLALHQPVAIDLRMIIAVLKINNDLERVGDLGADIAERGVFFATHPPVDWPFDFPLMAKKVQHMLQQSLDALVNLDLDIAQAVLKADDVVDDMHGKVFQQVTTSIQATPIQVEYFLNYLSVSRYLERMADHVTNIAEDVIYLVEGEIVRHIKEFPLTKKTE